MGLDWSQKVELKSACAVWKRQLCTKDSLSHLDAYLMGGQDKEVGTQPNGQDVFLWEAQTVHKMETQWSAIEFLACETKDMTSASFQGSAIL